MATVIGIAFVIIIVVLIIARRTPGSKPPTMTGGSDTHRGMFGKL